MEDGPNALLARGAVYTPAHEAAFPSPRGEEETEDDFLVRAHIDPVYLRMVQLVSSPTRPDLHVEGLRILAHLCRRALQLLLPLNQVTPVAECEFAGIATLCRGEEEDRYGKWPYSRETTLKWFVLLEALTVIRRFRRKGKTVIQIPLGKREPLSKAQLLANLDKYASKYTNSKTYELLMRAKADIEHYGVPSSELEEGDFLDQQALQTVQRQLVEKLQECGVSRATSRKVALWLTSGPLAQLAKDYPHAARTTTTAAGKAIPAQHDASALAHATRGGQLGSEQGDFARQEYAQSERLHAASTSRSRFDDPQGDFEIQKVVHQTAMEAPSEQNRLEYNLLSAEQGDFARQEYAQSEGLHAASAPRNRLLDHQGDFEMQKVVRQTAMEASSEQNRLEYNLLSAEQGDFQRAQSSAATAVPAAEVALPARQGDSAAVVSNSNSISFSKDPTKESEFELDTTTQHSMPESPASPADRRAEAMYLWTQLYSDEQRNAPGGQRLIGGLINKLNERPDLVRLAMVNVLLQRFFPDRHGIPSGGGAKWFYRSYAGYLSGQFTPSPEITSWASSPYSYEQIERALRAECVSQQADVFGKPHRPLASCVVEHHLLETVLDGTVIEARPEHQTTQCDAAPTAERYDRAAQRRQQEDEPAPVQRAGALTQAYEAPAAVHEDSMKAASQANQSQHGVYTQKVVAVEDPQAGWTSLREVLWWHEKVTDTSLSASCRIEILPTEYGRYVLAVTPYEDEAAAWFWSGGRQVREYLERLRAARGQTPQPRRSARRQMEQLASLEQT